MRTWLLHAPWWVLSLLSGGIFAAAMIFLGIIREGDRGTEAVVSGVLAGIFFGAVMGPWAARQNRGYREAVEGVGTADLRRVNAAVRGGPVPTDPAIRAAAHRVAVLQRDQLIGQRRWVVPGLGLILVLQLALALISSPWFWAAATVITGLLLAHLLQARRLARRAELLSEPPAGSS